MEIKLKNPLNTIYKKINLKTKRHNSFGTTEKIKMF